jgi:hypothetical protein
MIVAIKYDKSRGECEKGSLADIFLNCAAQKLKLRFISPVNIVGDSSELANDPILNKEEQITYAFLHYGPSALNVRPT